MEKLDSFTIGTSAQGGQVKVYFNMAEEKLEDIHQRINEAITIANEAKVAKRIRG